MSHTLMPRRFLMIPLVLAALGGCQDTTAPPAAPTAQFAQGDNGIWTVTTLEDAAPSDFVCDDHCTLRDAVFAAPAGSQIVFAAGLNGTINLAESISIVQELVIDGAGRITLDAQGNGHAVTTQQSKIELAGLTITGGSLGGVWNINNGTLTLRSVSVIGNTSTIEGGGIRSVGQALVLLNSSILDNETSGPGGGIWTSNTLTVVHSTIADNSADGDGGGIYLSGASATITGTTISGNSSDGFEGGAAIYNRFGSVAIRSSTITKNMVDNPAAGGALTAESGAAPGQDATTSLANTIIGGNTGGDCTQLNGGVISSLGYNLGGCFFFSEPSDIVVSTAQLFTEVVEEQLKDDGGPTKTHALIARGRAIDAGYCPGETTDQRGFTRPVDDPVMPNALDACDIGAYELQGPVAAVADLMVSQAVDKTSVKQGELLTYFVRVQNLGPDDATNVVVTDVLSSGVTFVEARGNQGSFTAPPKGETGTVTWYLGNLLDQGNEVAEIQVTVLVRGRTTITSTATVAGDVADPNEANNTAAITVSVAAGTGGKGGPKK